MQGETEEKDQLCGRGGIMMQRYGNQNWKGMGARGQREGFDEMNVIGGQREVIGTNIYSAAEILTDSLFL